MFLFLFQPGFLLMQSLRKDAQKKIEGAFFCNS